MPVKRLDTDQPLGSKKPKYKKVELSNEQRFEIVTYHLNNKHLKNIELCQHFDPDMLFCYPQIVRIKEVRL